MSAAVDLFVEEARAVSVFDAADRLGVLGRLGGRGDERTGPCPACGGKDRFGVNRKNNAWNCRGAGGGRDGIGLAAHVLGLDVARRGDFLAACSAVTGQPVPDGEGESDAERQAREVRLAARRREAEAREAERAKASGDFRERERAKARGKWAARQAGPAHLEYLSRRLDLPRGDLPLLPLIGLLPAEPYWHGEDERGRPLAVHEGPAMVAPFVDAEGRVIGCHLTWIDLKAPQRKFRPALRDDNGEPLATKKMRGSKKGGFIPLVGFDLVDGLVRPQEGRRRMVSGEGIENVVGVAMAEGVRRDTLYLAAGDLGNLAGPDNPASRFPHPSQKKEDRGGRMRAITVQGPVPKPGQGPDDAMPLPPGVNEAVLLCDADSDPVATTAAMMRAKARMEEAACATALAWPPMGLDFADLVRGRETA